MDLGRESRQRLAADRRPGSSSTLGPASPYYVPTPSNRALYAAVTTYIVLTLVGLGGAGEPTGGEDDAPS